MFFHHPYDNARILEIFFKAWRVNRKNTFKDLTQAELAKLAGVDRKFVNAAENYCSVLRSSSKFRKFNRNDLLTFLAGTKNMGLNDWEERFDIVSWLYDGTFVEFWEKVKFFDTKDERNQNLKHREYPRKIVMELLRRAHEIFQGEAENERRHPQVRVIPYRDDKDVVGQDLLKMEQIPGVWLIMKQYPSFLFRCMDVQKGKITCTGERSIDNKRVENLITAIDQFGVKIILEQDAMIQYLPSNKPVKRGLEGVRRRQIEALIHLMEKYRNKFQVRLAERTTPFEFQLNALEVVMVRARLRPEEHAGKNTGLSSYIRYIEMKSERNTIPFLLEFETMWDQLEPEFGSRDEKRINQKAIKVLESYLT